MKITKENLKELTTKEIYKYISEIVNKLLNYYDYLDLSQEEIQKLIYTEIEKSKEEYQGEKTYIHYIKEQIRIILNKKRISLLNNDKTKIKVLDNYLKSRTTKSSDLKAAISNLNKFSIFLEKNYVIIT